jgi:glycogenin glucosyltransferase
MAALSDSRAVVDVATTSRNSKPDVDCAPAAAEAWVTMITSDDFVMGLEVMVASLRKHMATPRRIACIVSEHVSPRIRAKITAMDVAILQVDAIPMHHGSTAASDGTHVSSWIATGLTKLHVFNLTQFTKVVYIDADMLVVDCVDELFDRPGAPRPAACPDVFPPDRFNAGMMVIEPNAATFAMLLEKSQVLMSYDGGDTGFLNAVFNDWFAADARFRVPFTYNAQRILHWFTHR